MKTYTLKQFVKMFNDGILPEDESDLTPLWCNYMLGEVIEGNYHHTVIMRRGTACKTKFTYDEWIKYVNENCGGNV